MSRRTPGPGQVPLFDLPRRQAVHIGVSTCLVCKVSLAVLAGWDDCWCCPGWVEPAPPWALLTAVADPAGAAGALEAA
jgi:hypothetical protein